MPSPGFRTSRSYRKADIRRITIALAITALALAGVVASGSAATAAAAKGKYIVVLKDTVTDPGSIARGQAAKYDGTVGFVYSHALKGYSVTMPVADVPLVGRTPL